MGAGSSAGFSAEGLTSCSPAAMLMSSVGVSSLEAESCLAAFGAAAGGVAGAAADAAAVAASSSSASDSLSGSACAASSSAHAAGRQRSTASAYCWMACVCMQ